MPIDTNSLPIEDQFDLDTVSEAIWILVNSDPEPSDE